MENTITDGHILEIRKIEVYKSIFRFLLSYDHHTSEFRTKASIKTAQQKECEAPYKGI